MKKYLGGGLTHSKQIKQMELSQTEGEHTNNKKY